MTTTAPVSVDWIRLTIGDEELTIEPSPGIELRLTVKPVEYEGYLEPLTRGPAPQIHFSVDLVPADTDAIIRSENEAVRILERLDARNPMLLRMFTLEAALGGEGLPYNRVTAPKLQLAISEPPHFDDDQPVPAVHVFTAKVPAGSDVAYTMASAA